MLFDKILLTLTILSLGFYTFTGVQDEIENTKKSLKTTGYVALGAAGVVVAQQALKNMSKENPLAGRRSLISAGDVFGAGGISQGAGTIVTGIGIITVAGAVMYGIYKFYNLIDLRFEAQEEQHKAEQELALRKNNQEWQDRLDRALTAQTEQIGIITARGIQQSEQTILRHKQDTLNIIGPVITGVQSLSKTVQQDRLATHRRLDPIVSYLQDIHPIIQKISHDASQATKLDEALTELQTNKKNDESTDDSSVSNPLQQATNNLNAIQAATAAATAAAAVSSLKPTSEIPTIKITAPEVKNKTTTCCSIC